ncbi:MATE efflux family protein 4, chloroplastic [Gossypium arboreum]|uniref:Protein DETOXIFICATION n=1 Tax=Gossypium arboreum TaxID=29729 RepID=A0A0B0N6G4_GOSAR|nr:MATE efflux family protein 4, chloroplastic [Gossypium arboreum]
MMLTSKTLIQPPSIHLPNPNLKLSPSIPKRSTFSSLPFHRSFLLSFSHNLTPQNPSRHCISPGQELSYENEDLVEEQNEEEEVEISREIKGEGLANQSIWNQMKEIVMFTGPATGLWLCGPLMSLIDTAVIGQGSSIELAALGYMFMFLSIATSNMVATSLARRDKNGVQHQISILLFIGLFCGFLMLILTRFFGSWALTAFSGPKNAHLVPAGNTYVQIRSLAWPAVLVGWVAQSASLGMKDSWGPLKALAVSSAINGIGDVALCMFLGYGIAGAAWATMVSQVVAAYMMIDALNKKGYNAFAISIPTFEELLSVLAIAGPVFVTLTAKVIFYSVLVYFATSMGTHTVAAHQVLLQTYAMCTVWGEPLSQTAQSFMPELIYGVNRSLPKARMLLKSLVTIGATLGLVLGIIGTAVPRFFPNIFTPDVKVIQEMHKVLLPYFLALAITPSTHSLEGTLLAGRDLRFISLSMTGCLAFGALIPPLLTSTGCGLASCWFALMGFQWARFFLSLQRLLSSNGILYSEDLTRFELKDMKAS